MTRRTVEREDILNSLKDALEPLGFVGAMWEGGAAAFGRVDEWSDIDLQVLCDDDRVEDVFEAATAALQRLSTIHLTFRFPEPTWHGHSQAFYRLAGASKFLLVDFVVMKRGSTSDRFLQPAVHGRPFIHFDKKGEVVWEPLDAAAFAEKLRGRIATTRVLFDMFLPFVEKELNRGNAVEAMAYYHSVVLRPLVELLRIVHAPLRHNFYARYVYYEMPGDVVKRLEHMFFVAGAEDLRERCEEAESWIGEILGELGAGPEESNISDAIRREKGGFGRE